MDFKTMSIDEIKAHFDIGEDVPLDLIKLLGQMNASALPKDFAELPQNKYDQSVLISNESGRIVILYDRVLVDHEFSENPVVVQALVHHMLTDDKIFCIKPDSTFSVKEQGLVFELLMPESQTEEILRKIKTPTVNTLAKIFRVPQDFVRKRLDAMGTEKQIAGYNF